MKYESVDQLLERSAQLSELHLGDLDPSLLLIFPSRHNKGLIGDTVEGFFGVEVGNSQAPDFPEIGIELKSAPVRKTSKGWSAKERISITQIGYEDVLEIDYTHSHLREKTRGILMVFYQFIEDTPIGEFPLVLETLWRPTEFEEDALQTTYQYVQQVVEEGRAHELSASDTVFIETATKGTRNNTATQPNSDVHARKRAFCFKSGGITQIVRDVFASTRPRYSSTPPVALGVYAEKVPMELDSDGLAVVDAAFPAESDIRPPATVGEIDAYLHELSADWIGKSFIEIQAEVAPETIEHRGKGRVAAVGRRLLGAPPGSVQVPELARLGLTVRTARVNPENLRPYEATSMPRIRYSDIEDMTWEESPERDLLTDMVFVVFGGAQGDENSLRLLGVVRWRPTEDDTRLLEREWTELMTYVVAGNMEGIPTAQSTTALHIRPHGADGEDTERLPSGEDFVKSSYWLNKDWLQTLFVCELGPT